MGQTSEISLQTVKQNKMKTETRAQKGKKHKMQKRQCSDCENPSSTAAL